MGIDVIPTEAISVPDGAHTGKIFDVKEEVRGEGKYTYVDVYVTVDGLFKTDGDAVVIKDGMAKHLSSGSKLGKTCMRFGLAAEELERSVREQIPIDITKFLKDNTPVKYMVLNEESKDGKTYARIVEGSLKPSQEPTTEQQEAKTDTEKTAEETKPEDKKEEPNGSSTSLIDDAMEKAKKEAFDAFGP